MKTTCLMGIACVSLALLTVRASDTNSPTAQPEAFDITKISAAIPEPFPVQFDGLINNTSFTNLVPVAVYYFENNRTRFASVGLAYTGQGGYQVILPEHLFVKGQDCAYAFRVARPGNTNIDGFINAVIPPGEEAGECDIAFAPTGPTSRVIEGIYDKPFIARACPFPATAVTMKGKKVASIRSLITGKVALIVGYNTDGTNAEPRSIIVEAKNGEGYGGSPFYDEYGRFYILNAAMSTNDSLFKNINHQFRDQIHRDSQGIAYLVGPMDFSGSAY